MKIFVILKHSDNGRNGTDTYAIAAWLDEPAAQADVANRRKAASLDEDFDYMEVEVKDGGQ